MRTETMRRLDRWLGKISLWSGRLIAPLLSQGPPLERRVVVTKFFGLGSLLQTYRLLDALRAEGYEVAVLTFKNNIPFGKQMRGPVHFIPIDPSSPIRFVRSSWQAARAMNQWRPQVYLDLELFSYYSALLGILSNAPVRVAFFSVIRPRLFYMTHRVRLNTFVHISHNYLQFARPLVAADTFEKAARRFQPKEIFKEIPPSDCSAPYVVFAPYGSDTLGGLKIWPNGHWRRLAMLLTKKHPQVKIFIVGAPSDLAESEKLTQAINHPNVENLVGRTSLDALFRLLAHAALTIAIDSFPFHLSTLLGRPTIGLFGPETPVHYGPGDQPRSVALTAGVHCSPCINIYAGKVSELACTNNVCLQQILPEQVMQTIETHGWPA